MQGGCDLRPNSVPSAKFCIARDRHLHMLQVNPLRKRKRTNVGGGCGRACGNASVLYDTACSVPFGPETADPGSASAQRAETRNGFVEVPTTSTVGFSNLQARHGGATSGRIRRTPHPWCSCRRRRPGAFSFVLRASSKSTLPKTQRPCITRLNCFWPRLWQRQHRKTTKSSSWPRAHIIIESRAMVFVDRRF